MSKFCHNCGAALQEGGSFCPHCGAPVAASSEQPAGQQPCQQPADQQSYQQQPADQQPYADQYQQPYQQSYQQPAGQQQYQDVYTYDQTQPQACQMPSKITGVTAARWAWNDMKAEEGWLPKMVVLGLVNCVGILDFFTTGFGMEWGLSVAYGRKDKLTYSFFKGNFFKMGFFIAVAMLCWYFVLSLLSSIPLVGIVVAVFGMPLMTLAFMRIGMHKRLGAGFEISKTWQFYAKNLGEIMGMYWVPSLILCCFSLVIGIFAGLCGGSSIVALVTATTYNAMSVALAGLGAGGIIICTIAIIFIDLLSTVATFVIYRAYGYYIAYNNPTWVAESWTEHHTL